MSSEDWLHVASIAASLLKIGLSLALIGYVLRRRRLRKRDEIRFHR